MKGLVVHQSTNHDIFEFLILSPVDVHNTEYANVWYNSANKVDTYLFSGCTAMPHGLFKLSGTITLTCPSKFWSRSEKTWSIEAMRIWLKLKSVQYRLLATQSTANPWTFRAKEKISHALCFLKSHLLFSHFLTCKQLKHWCAHSIPLPFSIHMLQNVSDNDIT